MVNPVVRLRGLQDNRLSVPALKRWAIFIRPLRGRSRTTIHEITRTNTKPTNLCNIDFSLCPTAPQTKVYVTCSCDFVDRIQRLVAAAIDLEAAFLSSAILTARLRSSIRSPASSMPTEIRTKSMGGPSCCFRFAGILACDMWQGRLIVEPTDPKLTAIVNSLVASTIFCETSGSRVVKVT